MKSPRIRPRDLCSDCTSGHKVKGSRHTYSCAIRKQDVQNDTSHCLYYSGNRLPIDIVIITAVDVEFHAVLDELHPNGRSAWGDPITTVVDGLWHTCLYHCPDDPRASVRIALAKPPHMGLTAAANLTTIAVQLFRPTYVVMLGIAAGHQEKTKVGDVIVPLEVWDYGAGKWEDRDGTLNFIPRGRHLSVEDEVRQIGEVIKQDKDFFASLRIEWASRNPDDDLPRVPSVHFRPMVSGAAVVNAEQIWSEVLKQSDQIIALDMEAFAVLHSCSAAYGIHYRPNCIIVKSVCDYGTKKKDDAQSYAAFTSTRFFRKYLETWILGKAQRNGRLSHVPKEE